MKAKLKPSDPALYPLHNPQVQVLLPQLPRVGLQNSSPLYNCVKVSDNLLYFLWLIREALTTFVKTMQKICSPFR